MKKNIFVLLYLSIGINLALAQTVVLTDYEQDYLDEMNEARTNPNLYATYVQDMLDSFVNEKQYMDEGAKYTSTEGKKVFLETIEFLNKQLPINPLEVSKGMSQAAKDHVNDLGPKGTFAHESTDKTQPDQRVNRYGLWLKTFGENLSAGKMTARKHILNLIIDDGILTRGHRKNIYSKAFTKVGVACGQHSKYYGICVSDFAGGYVERTEGGPILIGDF